jgi:uncharacterized protein involved in outer membrane biogenesis
MRKALVALAILAGIVIVVAALAWNSLDLIVRAALEHWGPDVTGVKVEVAGVQISPSDGRGRIAGLELGSPPGFSAAHVARFGEIRLAVDPATLASEVIVVRELAVESLQVTYERGDKATNLDAIQRRIEAYAKRSDPGGAKEPGRLVAKRKFVIERLAIRKARVLMTTRGLGGQGLTFELPDVELRDVGKRQEGLTASQVAAVVASTLQQKIALRVLTNIDALRRGGLEGAVDALKGLIK